MYRMIALLLLFVCGQVGAAAFRSCPGWLESAVEAIEAVPEAEGLLREVERDGAVRLSVGQSGEFKAYWEGGSRTITLNTRYGRGLGRSISSIVFELCNAAACRELGQLWRQAGRGQVTREDFVRGVERIEFGNLSRAAAIVRAGVQRRIFPSDTSCWAPTDFEWYLRCQKSSGHSKYLARQYDQVRRWAGGHRGSSA